MKKLRKTLLLHLFSIILALNMLSMPSVHAASGYSETFNYTGGVQTFVAPYTGTYQLDVYGAQGGGTYGGLGGYASGTVELNKGEELYVVVGGQGCFDMEINPSDPDDYTRINSPGYNGGGKNSIYYSSGYTRAYPGGGATHIAKGTNRGELKNYASYQSEVLIVGGAGGGSGEDGRSKGGVGGGENGGRPTDENNVVHAAFATGGTQTSGGAAASDEEDGDWIYGLAGSFGQGGDANGGNESADFSCGAGGGGGGWYGGGGGAAMGDGSYTTQGGAGGSSYIGCVTNGITRSGEWSGNGQAKITLLYSTLGLSVGTYPAVIKETESITFTATLENATSYTWLMQECGTKTTPSSTDWVTVSSSIQGHSVSNITLVDGYYNGNTSVTLTSTYGTPSAWYKIVAYGDNGQELSQIMGIDVLKLECTSITATYNNAIEAGDSLNISAVNFIANYENGTTRSVNNLITASFVVNGSDVKSITPRHVSNNELYAVKCSFDGKEFTCDLKLKVIDTTAPVADTVNYTYGMELVDYTFIDDGSYDSVELKIHATDNSDGVLSYRIENQESGIDTGEQTDNTFVLDYVEDGVLKIYVSDPSGNVLQYEIPQEKIFISCNGLEARYDQAIEAGEQLSIKDVNVVVSYTDGRSEDVTGQNGLYFLIDGQKVDTISPRHVSDAEIYTVGYEYRGKEFTCNLNLKVIDTTAPVADTVNYTYGMELLDYTFAEDGSYDSVELKIHATDNSDGVLSYRIENQESGIDTGEQTDNTFVLDYVEDGVLKIYVSDPSGNVLQYEIPREKVFISCNSLGARYDQAIEAGEQLSIKDVNVVVSYTDGRSEDATGQNGLYFLIDGQKVDTISPRHVSDAEIYTVGYEYRGKEFTCDLKLKVIDTTAPVADTSINVYGVEILGYIFAEDGSYDSADIKIHALDNSDGILSYRIIHPNDNYDSGDCESNVFTLNYLDNSAITVYVSDPSKNVLEFIILNDQIFEKIEPLPVPPIILEAIPVMTDSEDEKIALIVPEKVPVLEVEVLATDDDDEEEIVVDEPIITVEIPKPQPSVSPKENPPELEEETTTEDFWLDVLASPQFIATVATVSSSGATGGMIYFVIFWIFRKCTIKDAESGKILCKVRIKRAKHNVYKINVPTRVLGQIMSDIEVNFGKKFAKSNLGKPVDISIGKQIFEETIQEKIYLEI